MYSPEAHQNLLRAARATTGSSVCLGPGDRGSVRRTIKGGFFRKDEFRLEPVDTRKPLFTGLLLGEYGRTSKWQGNFEFTEWSEVWVKPDGTVAEVNIERRESYHPAYIAHFDVVVLEYGDGGYPFRRLLDDGYLSLDGRNLLR